DPGLRPVGRDHAKLRCVDLLVAPHPLCCTSDSSTLPHLAPAAVELDAESFDERLRARRAQVLAASCTHRQEISGHFLVARHQQIRNTPQRVLANLKADFLVAQVGLYAKALVFQGFRNAKDIFILALRDADHDRLYRRQPGWEFPRMMLEQDRYKAPQ